ncbi:MAG: transcriptional regulator NrdR [Acidimicrobiales bacterium]
MRCPWCAAVDDRVVDSREVERGEAIRRRRECSRCGGRFTTYERSTEAIVWVLKRSGHRVPFDRAKVIAGVRAACKNRRVDDEQIDALGARVEDAMRDQGPQVTSDHVGRSVLEHLRLLDDVASVRFASVYKGFEDVGDFARELGLLESQETAGARAQMLPGEPLGLEKQTPPKPPTQRQGSGR